MRNTERESLEMLAQLFIERRRQAGGDLGETGTGTTVLADLTVQAHPNGFVSRRWGFQVDDQSAWVTEMALGMEVEGTKEVSYRVVSCPTPSAFESANGEVTIKIETKAVTEVGVGNDRWWTKEIGFRKEAEAKEKRINLEHTPTGGDQFGNDVVEVRDGVTKLLLKVDEFLARKGGE